MPSGPTPATSPWAARLAIEDAGLSKRDFDGQGLAAIYTTNHSQPFWPEEVAAILGITPDPITARITNRGMRVMGIPSGLGANGGGFGYTIPA